MLKTPRTILVATACLAMTAAAPAAAATKSKRKACATRGTTTAANAKVRVFSVKRSGGQRFYFGCAYGRKPRLLGLTDPAGEGAPELRGVTLRGRLVTYVSKSCGAALCEYAFRTRNLRSWRVTRRADAMGIGAATLAVASDGSFAFGLLAAGQGPGAHPLIAAVGPGGTRTLDSGFEVDHHSLAIGGTTVYWLRDGDARSAELP